MSNFMYSKKVSTKMQERLTTFLESIGLVDMEDDEVVPLAEIRGISNKGKSWDLNLCVDAKTAARLVTKKTGMKPTYLRSDGSHFWSFDIPGKGWFTFESYKSGSQYMGIRHEPLKA